LGDNKDIMPTYMYIYICMYVCIKIFSVGCETYSFMYTVYAIKKRCLILS
jgi:hypothetical protein